MVQVGRSLGRGETEILCHHAIQKDQGATRLLIGLSSPALSSPPTSCAQVPRPCSREALPVAEPSVNVRTRRGSSHSGHEGAIAGSVCWRWLYGERGAGLRVVTGTEGGVPELCQQVGAAPREVAGLGQAGLRPTG